MANMTAKVDASKSIAFLVNELAVKIKRLVLRFHSAFNFFFRFSESRLGSGLGHHRPRHG